MKKMEINNEIVSINVEMPSLKRNETLELTVEGINILQYDSITIEIAKVFENYTDSVFSKTFPMSELQKSIKILLSAKVFDVGLYMIPVIHLNKNSNTVLLKYNENEFNRVLFEIKEDAEKGNSKEMLLEIYKEILEKREREYLSGFGIKNGKNKYIGFVFVKNCLLSRKMILGKYDISPFTGLSCTDELKVLQEFVLKEGLQKLDNFEEVMKKCRTKSAYSYSSLP